LADRYLTEHARRFKRSADADERNLRLHVRPHWAHRDATKIERADVIELIERIVAADKPVLANRVQALVSSVFSFAVDAALVKTNPCVRLRKRGQETVRTRTLTDDEIRLFWNRIVESPVSRPVGIALRLVLLLGVRPGEAAGMARAELEFENGKPVAWTIPAARAKNGRAHYLPLPALARDLIGEALALAGNSSAFVFPSRGDAAAIEGHALAVAMRRFVASLPAKEKSWRKDPPSAHDLRRTCATRLSAAGVPAEDVAAILNHVRGDVTGRHYDQYRRADEKRRALDRWALILAAVLKPAPANVVALQR
jgi:integrase